MRIGGKISPLSGDPLDLECTVKALKHDLVMTGLSNTPTAMGDCALVEANGIEIVLITLRNQAMGTDLFTQLGCDLAQEDHRREVVAALLRVVLEGREARDLRGRTRRRDVRPQHAALSQGAPAQVAYRRRSLILLFSSFFRHRPEYRR
jgi:hypothetical protein